jgi:aminobenzoyl-glutamate utilization protein B
MKSIDAGYDQYTQVANKIWEYAEVGYQETKSSALLQENTFAGRF